MSASAITALVRANLIRLVRDRSAFFFLGVLPFLIVFLVGLSFGGGQDRITIGVAAPGTPLAVDLVDRLRADDAVEVRGYDDERAVREAVEQGTVVGGVLVPEGYDAAVQGGDGVRVELVTDDGSGLPAAIRGTVDAAVQQADARIVALRTAGEEDLAAGLPRLEGLDRSVTVERRSLGGGSTLPTGYQGTAGQNLILFVFITSLVGGAALIQTRQLGVTRRALAAPLQVRSLLAGEALSTYVIALGQGLIVIVGTALLFGVTWAHLPATALVIGVFALVGTGAAMLLGATLSTTAQADSLAAPLGIGIGMLGGCMWPLEVVPGWMQVVGHVTPHAWAVDAINALQGRGASLADIATELAVLTGFAVALLGVSTGLLRQTLTR